MFQQSGNILKSLFNCLGVKLFFYVRMFAKQFYAMITGTLAIIKYYRFKIFSYQIAELMTLSMFVIGFKHILSCLSINDYSTIRVF